MIPFVILISHVFLTQKGEKRARSFSLSTYPTSFSTMPPKAESFTAKLDKEALDYFHVSVFQWVSLVLSPPSLTSDPSPIITTSSSILHQSNHNHHHDTVTMVFIEYSSSHMMAGSLLIVFPASIIPLRIFEHKIQRVIKREM